MQVDDPDNEAARASYRNFVDRYARLGEIKLAEARRVSTTERYRRFLDLHFFFREVDELAKFDADRGR